MNTAEIQRIEEDIVKLGFNEQLFLLERLAHRIRENTEVGKTQTSYNPLLEMANDPDIQRELRQLNKEFLVTDNDGLENL